MKLRIKDHLYDEPNPSTWTLREARHIATPPDPDNPARGGYGLTPVDFIDALNDFSDLRNPAAWEAMCWVALNRAPAEERACDPADVGSLRWDEFGWAAEDGAVAEAPDPHEPAGPDAADIETTPAATSTGATES